jgi:hypothetical protein
LLTVPCAPQVARDRTCIQHSVARSRDPWHEARRRTIEEFTHAFVGADSLVRAALEKFGSPTFCVSLVALCVFSFLVMRMVFATLQSARQCFFPAESLPFVAAKKIE